MTECPPLFFVYGHEATLLFDFLFLFPPDSTLSTTTYDAVGPAEEARQLSRLSTLNSERRQCVRQNIHVIM